MSLLARFDPGDTLTGLILICVIQTSLIIFLGRTVRPNNSAMASTCAVMASGWEHSVLVLISPALAGVADRSGLGLWVIPVAIPGPRKCDVDLRACGLKRPRWDRSPTTRDLTDRLAAAESAAATRKQDDSWLGRGSDCTRSGPDPCTASHWPSIRRRIHLHLGGRRADGHGPNGWRLATRGGVVRGRLRTLMGLRHGQTLVRVRAALALRHYHASPPRRAFAGPSQSGC